MGNQPHDKDKVATKRSGTQTYQKWWLRLSPKMFQNVVFCCEQDSDIGTSTLAISRVLGLEDQKKVNFPDLWVPFVQILRIAMTFFLGGLHRYKDPEQLQQLDLCQTLPDAKKRG